MIARQMLWNGELVHTRTRPFRGRFAQKSPARRCRADLARHPEASVRPRLLGSVYSAAKHRCSQLAHLHTAGAADPVARSRGVLTGLSQFRAPGKKSTRVYRPRDSFSQIVTLGRPSVTTKKSRAHPCELARFRRNSLPRNRQNNGLARGISRYSRGRVRFPSRTGSLSKPFAERTLGVPSNHRKRGTRPPNCGSFRRRGPRVTPGVTFGPRGSRHPTLRLSRLTDRRVNTQTGELTGASEPLG
jgi:hypothetical protein